MSPPCARTVSALVPPAFRLRGLDASILLCWPDAAVGSGADYAVDFSAWLCPGEALAKVAFSALAANFGWSGAPTFTPTAAVAWIIWRAEGAQIVEVTALTTQGRTLTATVNISIGAPAALIAPSPPGVAPNVLTLPDGTPLVTPSGAVLLAQ